MKNKFLTKEAVFAVLFAFVVWGAWAYWVNAASGNTAQAFKAGLTQGLYSGVMTFYMSLSVFFFWQRTKASKLNWLLPTLGTVGHTGLLLIGAHILNRTPNIAKTVIAPLTVAVIYCLFLTRNFRKNSEQK